MDYVQTPAPVLPSPRIPKTLGILNIVFAAGLLLCGACTGFYVLMLPALGTMVEKSQQKAKADAAVARKARVDSLAEREKAATTEEEKAEVKKEKDSLGSGDDADDMPDFNFSAMMGADDPRVFGYFAVDASTGLILNLLMMIAGIGLVGLKEWGRKLALWTAGLKIIRLVVLTSFMVAVVTPIMTKKSTEFQEKMIATMNRQAVRQGRPPMPNMGQQKQMAQIMAVYTAMWAIGLVGIGSIYPAVSLWLLSTSGARAACRPGKPSGQDPSW